MHIYLRYHLITLHRRGGLPLTKRASLTPIWKRSLAHRRASTLTELRLPRLVATSCPVSLIMNCHCAIRRYNHTGRPESLGALMIIVIAHYAHFSLAEAVIHTRAILRSNGRCTLNPAAEIRDVETLTPIRQCPDINWQDGIAERVPSCRSGESHVEAGI